MRILYELVTVIKKNHADRFMVLRPPRNGETMPLMKRLSLTSTGKPGRIPQA